jgi:hypothetical protein
MDIPDLVPVFREHVTGFAAEPPEVQRGLAATFWACESADSRFDAKTREFGAYLSSEIMISIWGSYPKMTRSVGFRYFGALQGDNLSHKVNLYYPNPEFVEAFKAFIRSPQPLTTINAAGQPALKRKPRQAIDSETPSGARRSGEGQPSAYLPIRLEALQALREDQLRPECRRSLYHLLTLSKVSNNPNEVPIRYVQHADSGGRLYEENNLQGVTRHIRSVALAGLWDYDISNCHFTLISQLVKLRGLSTPDIDEYLRNKRDRRSQLRKVLERASSTSVAEDDVKSAIISLAYGASLGYSPALAELFDNPDVHNAFRRDRWVMALESELRRCRDTLLGAYETNAGDYRILNRAGLQRSFSARDANRAFSFLVTGAEALILETVLKRWGPEIVLCIHDGWVAQSELSIVDMESEIREKTGFEVTIEGGQIVPNTVVECDGCAEYSHRRNREPDQWDSDVDVASNKTKGTTPILGGGSEASSVPGVGCGSSRRAYLGHPNDDPCFDADFRGSGWYITRRCSWNVSPNFRGVTARGGRPRGSRNRRG